MKRIFISCLVLTSAVATVVAQNKLSPETLWKFGRIAEPKVSPDGKTVVYSVTRYNVEENKGNAELFSVPVSGGNALQLTNTKTSENNARWRPDGKKIGYISSESGSPQLWEMNPDGSGKRQVSNISEGISNFNYSPKGTHIFFTRDIQIDQTLKQRYPDLPKANALEYDGLMMRHWNQWEDGAFSHVFFASYTDGKIGDAKDIMPGEAFDAPLMPFGGEEQLCWSSDGKTIAYTCKKLKGTDYAASTNSDIYLYNIETEKTINISEENKGYDTEPRFSPDGKSIVWLSMQTPGFEADKNRMILYDIATGNKKDLTEGFDQSAENVIWSKDSKTLYFGSATQATHQAYAYSFGAKKDMIKKLTDGLHDIGAFDVANDAKKTFLVASKMDISNPAELYKVDIAALTLTQITSTNKDILNTVKMGKVEKRMVKTTDGKDMLVWVIFPPDFDPAKKYPTLLYCQGGPQSVVSQFFSYRWNFQLMAANGYIIVAPNRRGLPSFGQQWNDEISGDWGGQCMRDYLSAIDDVSKENYVDKDRRGAVGASFGGYSVYWLAGHNEDKRFKSFIAHCGVFNLESMYGETEEIFFSDHDFGGPYWKNPKPKSYEDFSPINFVKNWNTPILVIHNNKDFRVPLGQGLQAYSAAQLQGIKSRFLYFEDEGHWVTKPQNGLLWQREFFRWLDETLKK
jgi:dipeptidyl aminopeptidase/acylaminoacyl peptidase